MTVAPTIVLTYLFFLCVQDIKTEMNSVLNPRAGGPEGSLIGIPGTLSRHSVVIHVQLRPVVHELKTLQVDNVVSLIIFSLSLVTRLIHVLLRFTNAFSILFFFVIIIGSNQAGNNLTLKGWPLTVSLFLLSIVAVQKQLFANDCIIV